MRTTPSGDRGASAVEYALIVTAIAGLITLVVFAFGAATQSLFQDSCNKIASQATSTTC
jgi:pilus assembly protein Flp/PilA